MLIVALSCNHFLVEFLFISEKVQLKRKFNISENQRFEVLFHNNNVQCIIYSSNKFYIEYVSNIQSFN